MNDIDRQRLRRRLDDAVHDIDEMKAQLREVRLACAELAAAMRQIREESRQAMDYAERRRRLKRVI
jgi:multidrug resistance efflux pump